MSNCITVPEIYQTQKTSQEDKSKYYNVILEKCYTKIRQAVKCKQWQMYYDVPKMVVGLPLYSINRATAYIMVHLKKAGYVIMIVPKMPNRIYISWEPKDVKTFNTLNNLKNMNNPMAVEDNLHYCNGYGEDLDLDKYNTANFQQYLEFIKQKKQLTLPAPISQNSSDIPVSNNLLNNTMVNDNLFITNPQAQNKIQLQHNQNNIYARINEPSNDILQQHYTNKNVNINKSYEPMNTILEDIHNQSQDLRSFPINREVPVKHNLPIADNHNIRLANKFREEEREHRENLIEARRMISETKYDTMTKERAYEREQNNVKKNQENLMDMNNLLMNRSYIEKQKEKQKEYIKKHKGIDSKGKNMFNL
jgi:hypothetical protein